MAAECQSGLGSDATCSTTICLEWLRSLLEKERIMRLVLLAVGVLLPSIAVAEDGPMSIEPTSELVTSETYGQCIGVPPICRYPDHPMCICQGLQVSCTWVCGH